MRCTLCGGQLTLVERWDSYACLTCRFWLEDACDCVEDCGFKGRPDRPPKRLKP